MKNADIKQLALLCELIETQSLTEAASRMAITASAASQSLARLRETLGDPVCIRQGQDYRLTPFGELAMERFRQVVSLWRQASEEAGGFDPSACTDRLSIACSEAVAIVDPAELYADIVAAAPWVSLDLQSADNSLADIAALRAAQVDLVCTHLPPPPDAGDLHAAHLGPWHATVCCLSKRHPRICNTIDLEQYLAEVHLVTLYGNRRESLASPLSITLGHQGRQRRISLVHSVRVAADILSRTDRLVTCNLEQARMISRMAPDVHALPLPGELKLPALDLYMVWHQRTQFSAAHRWLRDQVTQLVQRNRVPELNGFDPRGVSA